LLFSKGLAEPAQICSHTDKQATELNDYSINGFISGSYAQTPTLGFSHTNSKTSMHQCNTKQNAQIFIV
jgi:hypothetical protein